MRTLILSLVFMMAALGCRTLKNEVDVNALLAERGDRAYLAGPVRGLGAARVLNRRDFIYGFAFDRPGLQLAFSHHVSTHMELSLSGTATGQAPRVTQQVNASEFDVEGVGFVEGRAGTTMLSASRQGNLQRYGLDGKPTGEFVYGVALTRLAVSPSQTLVAVGVADGRVILVGAGDLAFRGELKAHKDEVRGLAFVDDQTLVSVGFDGELAVLKIEPGGPEIARVAATEVDQGMRVFLTHLGGREAIATTRDLRQPTTTVSAAAVRRLGLKPAAGEPLAVMTPVGPSTRPGVVLDDVQVRYLAFGELIAAVCDECVPGGAELVLGQDALARATFGDDIGAGEVMVRTPEAAAEGVVPAQRIAGALNLVPLRQVKLPGPATDVTLSRSGQALVSYSHARAERSPEIYDAEKEGKLPPMGPSSGAVLVDVGSGELGRRFIGHRGFTVSGAISPDGATVATGGWDDRVVLFDVATGNQIHELRMGWLVRQVRFSGDGRLLGVAAWTRTNATGDGRSDPAMVVYPVVFKDPKAKSGAKAVRSPKDGVP